jgi:predicted Zn-ribbon and HTH transcriptional regulator
MGFSHKIGAINYHNCKCLLCNEIYTVDIRNINAGTSKNCKKCGYKIGHNKQKNTIRTKRTAKESAEYYFFMQYRKDGKKRGYNWNLTLEQFTALIYGNCHYCGKPPSAIRTPLKHMGMSQKLTEEAKITVNGIDRKNNTIGYEPTNCVSCCKLHNQSKMDTSYEEYLQGIIDVYNHLNLDKKRGE